MTKNIKYQEIKNALNDAVKKAMQPFAGQELTAELAPRVQAAAAEASFACFESLRFRYELALDALGLSVLCEILMAQMAASPVSDPGPPDDNAPDEQKSIDTQKL